MPGLRSATWLSHDLASDTPTYGGGNGVTIEPVREMARGDTANTSRLVMGNHSGTHVDAPRHFVPQGMTVDEYAPADWFFIRPVLIDVPTGEEALVALADVQPAWTEEAAQADLILLRTGAENWRGERRYWEAGPGLDPEASEWLCSAAPGLKAVGLDMISLSSFAHREAGRRAHRVLLGHGILVIEDLHLSHLAHGASLRLVVALPLRIRSGDGAPVSVVGFVDG